MENYHATIGIDFKFKTMKVDGEVCKIQIVSSADIVGHRGPGEVQDPDHELLQRQPCSHPGVRLQFLRIQ